jgi:hypothetical protein
MVAEAAIVLVLLLALAREFCESTGLTKIVPPRMVARLERRAGSTTKPYAAR